MSAHYALSHAAAALTIVPTQGADVDSHTIESDSMVLLQGNFPRTFPSKNEDRQGGNPDGLLTTESMKETAMAKLFLPHDTSDSQVCESPTLEIPLTKGYVAIIDECDADLLDYRWCAVLQDDGRLVYAARWAGRRTGASTLMRLHRVIMARMVGHELLPRQIVDHIDGNTLNNRRSNLRLATASQNASNSKVNSNNKSGYKGVYFRPETGKYVAKIQVNGKGLHLGTFDAAEDAHAAYVEAAKLHFGEFANDGSGPVLS